MQDVPLNYALGKNQLAQVTFGLTNTCGLSFSTIMSGYPAINWVGKISKLRKGELLKKRVKKLVIGLEEQHLPNILWPVDCEIYLPGSYVIYWPITQSSYNPTALLHQNNPVLLYTSALLFCSFSQGSDC